MDPVSAIGLASAILTFIDFSTKVFRGTKKLYDSHSDVLEENASSELVASHMQRFSVELSTPDHSNSTLTGNDVQLCELASECKKIADEVIKLLEGLKRTDPKSWTQALRVAWRSETHRSKKDDLNKRLESCRSQFQLQLNYYTSKETMTQLGALLERFKESDIQMQKLQGYVVRLQETLKASVLDETAKHQVEELLRIPRETLAVIAQERVLGGIRFREIDQRFNDIRPAHSETFNWLFSDQRLTHEELQLMKSFANHDEYREEQKARDINRQMFAQWLSSGTGVFHFSAKLGAGKSTLMKEASKHDLINARLREWADPYELIIGNFFFWKPGKSYQKTLDGMLRGLLHHVLRSRPQLIPLLLPSRWDEAIETPWQTGKDIEVSDENVRTAFKCLISGTANDGSLRLVFFIDGLDEMEENTAHTYQDLVETINEWVIQSCGNVKICVSSREYSIFLNGFSGNQRLHLHHLTKLDMQRYVRNKLRNIPDAKDIDSLSNNIVDKSQGIFFFVTLVTKNIRQQLGDGASMDELLDQIDGLPDGLYELFRHVIMSQETHVRKIAYETLAMMQEAPSWGLSVPANGYAFFKDWRKNQQPDFAITHVIATSETSRILERARMEVKRYCKGLVETRYVWPSDELVYAHRSVADFLLEPTTAKDMKESIRDFDIRSSLSQISVLADRLEYPDGDVHCTKRDTSDLRLILNMRQADGLDQAPYMLLRSIDLNNWSVIQEHLYSDTCLVSPFDRKPTRVQGFLVPNIQLSSKGVSAHSKRLGTALGCCYIHKGRRSTKVNNPMFILTQMGNPDYALWQVKNCPESMRDGLRISLLVCCALSFHMCQHVTFDRGYDRGNARDLRTGPAILSALLDQQLVSPDYRMPCAFEPMLEVLKCSGIDPRPTTLQLVFMAAALVARVRNTDWVGSMIEALLQHSATLDFTISIENPSEGDCRVCLKQIGEESHAELVFKAHLLLYPSGLSERFFKVYRMQDWGPEEIVEACAFENEDRIVSLIRGQRLSKQTKATQMGNPNDCLSEEDLPSNLEPEEKPPALFEDQSPKNVPLSYVGKTWGWLILLVVGMMLGTIFSKLFAF